MLLFHEMEGDVGKIDYNLLMRALVVNGKIAEPGANCSVTCKSVALRSKKSLKQVYKLFRNQLNRNCV